MRVYVTSRTCQMGDSLFTWDWLPDENELAIFDENHLRPTEAERAILVPAILDYISKRARR